MVPTTGNTQSGVVLLNVYDRAEDVVSLRNEIFEQPAVLERLLKTQGEAAVEIASSAPMIARFLRPFAGPPEHNLIRPKGP